MTDTCRECSETNLWKQGYCRHHYLTEVVGWDDYRDLSSSGGGEGE